MERAQAVKPDFSLTQENAPTVAAICARLDGLPLAIELISARVKLLPPAALLERLHGRLMLQSDGLRDIEPRHRTLNAAIDWSYQLLSAEEQTLFRRLGVFVGGWTLEAAEAICTENLSHEPARWPGVAAGQKSGQAGSARQTASRASRCWKPSASMRWSSWLSSGELDDASAATCRLFPWRWQKH